MVAYSLGKIMGPILVSSLLNRLLLLTSINLGLYVLVLVRKHLSMFIHAGGLRLSKSRPNHSSSSSSNILLWPSKNK